jgi:hypothetical protein
MSESSCSIRAVSWLKTPFCSDQSQATTRSSWGSGKVDQAEDAARRALDVAADEVVVQQV